MDLRGSRSWSKIWLNRFKNQLNIALIEKAFDFECMTLVMENMHGELALNFRKISNILLGQSWYLQTF